MWKRIFSIVLPIFCLAMNTDFPETAPSQEARHPKIVLKGFNGDPLTLESKVPYSPRKTCGTCHDYARITNGYHFQQGRTDGTGKVVISDAFSLKFPWNLSSGMFGKHGLVSPDSSQLARKKSETPSDIDKSAFYFVQYCGACHPGGGGGEYDRNGILYYSEETRKWGNEQLEPGFLLDGDYTPYTMAELMFGAPWNKSGVSEADCLICHLKGYAWKERAAALRSREFRTAATAGAGWAPLTPPEGSEAFAAEGVTIDYTRKEVADFENLHLQIIRQTPDENCWACHESPDGKQQGQQWSAETDVHKAKRLSCLSCHPADKDHNLAKGDSIHLSVRDDLDNTMPSCEDCHYRGRERRAPRFRHPFSPRHMKRIACQTCHIPSQSAVADLVYDLASTGSPVVYDTSRFLSGDPLDPKASAAGADPTPWVPSLKEYKGRIVPVKPLVVIYWGDLDEKTNVVRPIPLWKVRTLSKPPLNDDDGDGIAEVNSPEEIKAFLKALKANDSFGTPVSAHPVLIKGGFLYQLDKKGDLEKIKHEQVAPLDLSLSHNVLSGQSVIGARGCKDCHSKSSLFFLRRILSDPFDASGKPAYSQAWERLGIDKDRLNRLLLEQ
jgi:hypothetical protein